MIKARYGNTPAEDDMLRRFLREKLTEAAPEPRRSPRQPSSDRNAASGREPPRAARHRSDGQSPPEESTATKVLPAAEP